MDTAFDVRRENLRRLIRDKYEGNRAAFSRAAGVHQNQINLILTDNPDHQRNLGEGLARRIEDALGIAPGYLDEPTPSTFGGKVHVIKAPDVPDDLVGIFARDDVRQSSSFYDSFLSGWAITSPSNLSLFKCATRDMDPELTFGDYVVVDTGVRAVTVDGIYVLGRGKDMFLRRVTRLITGGWEVKTPKQQHDEAVKIDSFKGFKVVARAVMLVKHIAL